MVQVRVGEISAVALFDVFGKRCGTLIASGDGTTTPDMVVDERPDDASVDSAAVRQTSFGNAIPILAYLT